MHDGVGAGAGSGGDGLGDGADDAREDRLRPWGRLRAFEASPVLLGPGEATGRGHAVPGRSACRDAGWVPGDRP